MSSVDSNEKLTVHTKSNNTDNMIDKDKDEIIQKLVDLLLRRYPTGREQSMKVKILCLVMSTD